MAKATSSLRLERNGPVSQQARMQQTRQQRARRNAVLAAFLCYVLIVLILASGSLLSSYPTEPGAVLDSPVTTPVELTVQDPDKLQAAKDAAFRNSPEIWIINLDHKSRVLQNLNSFVDLLRQSSPTNTEELNALVDQVYNQIGILLDPDTVSPMLPRRLAALPKPLDLNHLTAQLRTALNDLFDNYSIIGPTMRGRYAPHHASQRLQVRDEHNEIVREVRSPDQVIEWGPEVEQYLSTEALPRLLPDATPTLIDAATELLMRLIREPQLVYDEQLSRENERREIAALEENPPTTTFRPGEVVAAAGTPLTQLQVNALTKLNELQRALLLSKTLGLMLMTALIMGTVGLFLVRFHSGVQDSAMNVMLHALPVILALAIGQTAHALLKDPELVMLVFPAVMVGLLASLVINARAGFLLVLVATFLFGIANNQSMQFVAMALFAGFATVLTSRRLRERSDMIQIAWKLGLVYVLLVLIFSLIEGNWQPNPWHLVIAFLNSMMSVAVTLYLLWFFEKAFGVVTDLKLLELTGLRHPLIVQLEEKAPGSYQHVLNVMKLAEAAAHAIGANYLLVRAGALFHDIGKMVKPKYFSENQVTLEDKKAHSKLSPYMSVLIIKNHVKEGVELARRFKLPQTIIDFIPQHHGTGLIRYFYSAALKRYEESATADPVREEEFRYPGPKPQTIEAAIVLLADSVEAIAASKFTGGQVSEDEIRRVTQMAISERFNDGQFDECDLTMRHLRDMREAFLRTLMARYHFRVAYPSLPRQVTGAPRPDAGRSEPAIGSIAVAGPVSRGDAAG